MILPLILMGFIFFGGFHFLKKTDQFTNEQIAQTMTLDVDVKEENENILVEGTWNWNGTPQDIIIGDDYIGITLADENNKPIDFAVKEAKLQLYDHEEVIFETLGEKSGQGYVFSFPNQLEENQVFGYKGSFSLTMTTDKPIENQVIVSYLHTWADHGGILSTDPRFLNVEFTNPINDQFWVIERFSKLKEE